MNKKWLNKIGNNIEPVPIADHAQPTKRKMTYHQYLNILSNNTIYDKTGDLIE